MVLLWLWLLCCIALGESLQLVKFLPLSVPVNKVPGVVYPAEADAKIGEYYRLGYLIAEQHFEKKGGLVWQGQKVDFSKIPVLDRGNSSTSMSEFFSKLNSNEPAFVLGGYLSNLVKAEVDFTASQPNTIYINGGGATGSIYKQPPYGGNVDGRAFGLLASVEKLATTTLEFMKIQMDAGSITKPAQIALLWEDADHGRAYASAVVAASLAEPEYFEIVYGTDFPYPEKRQSVFSHLALDMVSAKRKLGKQGKKMTALMVDAHSTEFILIQNVLAEQQFDFEFVTYGARGGDPTNVAKLTRKESANELVSCEWWAPTLASEESKNFLSSWRSFVAFEWATKADKLADSLDFTEKLYETPSAGQPQATWYGALAYQTAQVLFEALNNSQPQTLQGVHDYLSKRTFKGSILPTGEISFKDNQAEYPFSVLQTEVREIDGDAVPGFDSVKATKVISSVVHPKSESTGSFHVKPPWSPADIPCSTQFIGLSMSPCGGSGHHEVSFYWMDLTGRPCQYEPDEDSSQACGCDQSAYGPLPKSVQLECDAVLAGSSSFTTIVVIASLGAAVAFASIIAVLRYYGNVVVRGGQREFLLVLSFAALWCNFSALAFLGPNTDEMCVSRVVNILLSLTLLVSSLTVKVYRIYRIWNNSSMKRVVVQAKDMFLLLAAIFSVMVLIIIIWCAVDTPHAVSYPRFVASLSNKALTAGSKCQYFESLAFPVISLLYVFCILVFCNVLSYQGRNADSAYMESQSIVFCSYTFFFLFAMVTVFSAVAELSNTSLVILISISLSASGTLFVGFIIGPKILFAASSDVDKARSAMLRFGGILSRKSSTSSAENSRSAPLNQSSTGGMSTASDPISTQ